MDKQNKQDLTNKDTEILFKEIKETSNIYRFIEKNSSQLYRPSLADYLNFLLKKYKLSKSALIFRSDLSRQYAYEIFPAKKIRHAPRSSPLF